MVRASQSVGVSNTIVFTGTFEARVRAQSFTEPLEREGIEVQHFRTPRWPPEAPDRFGLSVALVRWVARRVSGFDAVHLHGVWGFGLLGALAAAKSRGTPLVVTPHESMTAFDIDDSRSSLRRRQKLLLKRVYLQSSPVLVVTSELEARDSVPGFDPRRVRIVPCPLADHGAPVAPLPADPHRPLKVGFLGRIHHKKNLPLLIDAIARLDGARLLVAGDGEDAVTARERASALGLGERVEWRGFVGAEQRARFLEELDVLAMPSTFESFGMSAAEAMLHARPVLVSERTGIAEIIRRRGGGVVVPASPQAVADGLRQLDARRDELRAIGLAGRDAVLKELDPPAVGRKLVEAYEQAAELL